MDPIGMRRSTARCSITVLLLAVLLLTQILGPARALKDKCLACQTVAEEIEDGLSNERPRNHIDLRHRLDSKGRREGKVIDYKVSELRILELLEGLCQKFKEFTFQEGRWLKLIDGNMAPFARQAAERHSKELISYCGRLLETTEDELSNKFRKGEVKVGQVEDILCRELTNHCTQSRDRDDTEGDGSVESLESSDGEL